MSCLKHSHEEKLAQGRRSDPIADLRMRFLGFAHAITPLLLRVCYLLPQYAWLEEGFDSPETTVVKDICEQPYEC